MLNAVNKECIFFLSPSQGGLPAAGGLRYSGGLNGGSDGDRDGGGGERERQTETPVDRVIRLGLPQGTITSDAQAYSSRL